MPELPEPVPARIAPTYTQRKFSTGPGWRRFTDKTGGDGTREMIRRTVAEFDDRYQFQPLPSDCTRLLVVQPPEEDNKDHIKVTLRIVNFDDLGTERAPYEALSYCWGNEDADHSIFVLNDESQDSIPFTQIRKPRKFSVTPNLHAALCHLRKSRRTVILWIDAICMDQEKLDERQEQVSRMAEIYSKADRVLVWLGDGDSRTKNAIKMAKDIVAGNHDTSAVDLYDVSKTEAWSDFVYLTKSSWFSRRWVIQELALAQEATVHCGNDEIHWEDLRDAISIFMDHFDKVRDLFKRDPQYETDYKELTEPECLAARLLVDTINIIRRPHPTRTMPKSFDHVQPLEDLVSELSAFLTSDGRDTIYALRNICKENMSDDPVDVKFLAPDYSKDLLEVYAGFVQWVVDKTGELDILCRNWALPERKVRGLNYPELVVLPSWIRTTSNAPFATRNKPTRARYNADTLVGLPGKSPYKASGNTKARYSFHVDPPLSSSTVHQNVKSAVTTPPIADGESASSPTLNTRKALDTGFDPVNAVPGSAVRRSPRAPVPTINTNKRPANDDSSARTTPKRRKTGTTAPIQHAGASHFPPEERTKRSAYLSVDGVQIGTISWLTDPTTDGVVPERALKKLRGNIRMPDDDHSPVMKDIVDKLWRILCAEKGDHGTNPPTTFERACRSCLRYNTVNGHINLIDLLENAQVDDYVRKFLRRARAVIWNRRFLQVDKFVKKPLPLTEGEMRSSPEPITPSSDTSMSAGSHIPEDSKERYHGLGPSEARLGDIVCVFFGCSVPVVLRPCRTGNNLEYKLVGEAYIYGIMEGKAIPARGVDSEDKTTFKLR
ncbi:hypothetical protein AC578_8 [Pseudocercospora eumusae]|uniref:Heterokaryon incompatibility domain-containing protein n=1 Tax=Pseudocercospora eumusae TaxID=321146 RepID=A0A139GUV6_9PEZI|nr:hypothetical protein AC578_8 [Pseudocercospora eumusae]